jgi:hypothetical protein
MYDRGAARQAKLAGRKEPWRIPAWLLGAIACVALVALGLWLGHV